MFKYSLLTILLILMYGNEDSYAAVTSLSPIQNAKPIVNYWKHTSLIGTVTTPTVDGGIINSTENIPIYHVPIALIPLSINSQEDKPLHSLSVPIINFDNETTTSFNDNWATSDKIESILDNVAKTQKLHFVLQQSKILKLPASVALVPIVESAYREKAISNKGAIGVWQLMPRTAMEYGLDPAQRSNFIPETKAALLLLKNLHQQFGNWELAFAAYNAGSARVNKALNENPHATTINELNLPTETKNYVASIYRINNLLINTPINQFLP
jgi:hypothetical protein